jgi:hypothetical protein
VFEDSILFPFALSLLGIAIIYLGLQYQRRKVLVDAYVRAAVLPRLHGLVPPRVLAD